MIDRISLSSLLAVFDIKALFGSYIGAVIIAFTYALCLNNIVI